MSSLNDEELVVARHGRELCLLLEDPLYRNVGGAGSVWEWEGCGLLLLFSQNSYTCLRRYEIVIYSDFFFI